MQTRREPKADMLTKSVLFTGANGDVLGNPTWLGDGTNRAYSVANSSILEIRDISGAVLISNGYEPAWILVETCETEQPADLRQILMANSTASITKRKACLMRYEGIIFATMAHELSAINATTPERTSEYIDLDELPRIFLEPWDTFNNSSLDTSLQQSSVDTLSAAYIPHSLRYLIARTLIHGMLYSNLYINNMQKTAQNPMGFYWANYHSTLDNMGAGSLDPKDYLNPVRYNYNIDVRLPNTDKQYLTSKQWANAYAKFAPYIVAAIHDSVANVPDPTSSSVAFKPINGCIKFVPDDESCGANFQGGTGLPSITDRTMTFGVEVGTIEAICWSSRQDAENPKYPRSKCGIQQETILQAYERHLFLFYRNFSQLKVGPSVVIKFKDECGFLPNCQEVRYSLGVSKAFFIHTIRVTRQGGKVTGLAIDTFKIDQIALEIPEKTQLVAAPLFQYQYPGGNLAAQEMHFPAISPIPCNNCGGYPPRITATPIPGSN